MVRNVGPRRASPPQATPPNLGLVPVRLDFAATEAEKQWPVLNLPPNFYADWRAARVPEPRLGDRDETVPAESVLQQIWLHQRLRRDEFATADGRKVRVLHPGFWNREAGPDFRKAVIQFDGAPAVEGDIEIDLEAGGWKGHGHAGNPNYGNVVLHVIWEESPADPGSLPKLVLKNCLDSPLAELTHWFGGGESRQPECLKGECSAPLKALPTEVLRELLGQAARIRFQRKASQFAARARECGWEQALWEGLFGALGYKNNVWPMRRLAELIGVFRPLDRKEPPSRFVLQARLLGLSGLLPRELTRELRATDNYLRQLWDHWWREADQFEAHALPKSLWKLNGIRPANYPHRRLALAGHWLADSQFFAKLENWAVGFVKTGGEVESLAGALRAIDPNDFWSRHWSFNSKTLPEPQPLIGPQRVTDIAINVILPWLWIRAGAGKNQALQTTIEKRYFAWPAAEDNSALKLARQRLLGGDKSPNFRSAADQQGLLQIVRDFCDHSNALCRDCRFPDMVRAIRP